MGRRTGNYPPELRERAIRMVAEVRPDYPSHWPAICAIAQKLGIGTAETLRKWVRQAEVDAGTRPGLSSGEPAEVPSIPDIALTVTDHRPGLLPAEERSGRYGLGRCALEGAHWAGPETRFRSAAGEEPYADDAKSLTVQGSRGQQPNPISERRGGSSVR